MARIRDELRTSEWCAPIGRSMVGPINGRSIAGPMVDRSISWPVDWRVFSNKIPQSRAANYRGRRRVRRRNEEFLLRVKNSPLRLTVKALAVCSVRVMPIRLGTRTSRSLNANESTHKLSPFFDWQLVSLTVTVPLVELLVLFKLFGLEPPAIRAIIRR